jgi:hypothetical protein
MAIPRRAIEAGSGTADTVTLTPPPVAREEKPVTDAPSNSTPSGVPDESNWKLTNPEFAGVNVILTSSPTTMYEIPDRVVEIVVGGEIVPVAAE